MLNLQDIQRLHPAGVAVLLLAVVASLILDRRHLLLLFIAMLSIAPMAQRFVVFGIDFPFPRILTLAMLARISISRLAVTDRLRLPDLLVIGWFLWSAMAQGFIYGQFSPIVTRLGYGVDAIGAYYIGRSLLDSREAFIRMAGGMAVCAIAVVPVFLIEWSTGRNLFAAFGGVPDTTLVRDGRLRCQGPFTHPIMTGLFWGIWVPIILGWRAMEVSRARRGLALAGVGCTLAIVFFTASSTPVMAVLIGLLVSSLFCWRLMTGVVVATIGLALIPLHFMMEKGVLHLLARVNVVSGSTGWHRYHLMDRALAHLGEWWAVGTQSTGHWGLGLDDVTNQFVLEGVRGGLLALVLYVLLWLMILRAVVLRASLHGPNDRLFWSLFASLLAMFLSFIGVSIFGTVIPETFLLLGGSVTLAARSASRVEVCATLPSTGPILRREAACRTAAPVSCPV